MERLLMYTPLLLMLFACSVEVVHCHEAKLLPCHCISHMHKTCWQACTAVAPVGLLCWMLLLSQRLQLSAHII